MAYETTEVIQRESPEVEAYKLSLMEMAKELASKAPKGGIPDFEIAGMDPAQTKAYNQILDNVGNYTTSLDKGIASLDDADVAFKASQGDFDPNTIADFMNPYAPNVIDVYTKEALKQNAMLQNQLGLGSASQNAFGGGRQAIVGAQMAGDVADRTSKATADLLYKGYGDASKMALGAFEGARGRDLAAGKAMAGLGNQFAGIAGLTQDLGFKDAGMLYDMGTKQQAQKQAELDVARKNIMKDQQEPYQRLAFLSDIYQGAPSSTMQYTTAPADPGPSFLNQLVGGGITGASLYGAGKNIFT
tara:strand:- start:1053 stop:1958 length:906 start_codon:yes stop_codon:yes gene_type:complete